MGKNQTDRKYFFGERHAAIPTAVYAQLAGDYEQRRSARMSGGTLAHFDFGNKGGRKYATYFPGRQKRNMRPLVLRTQRESAIHGFYDSPPFACVVFEAYGAKGGESGSLRCPGRIPIAFNPPPWSRVIRNCPSAFRFPF